MRDLIAQGYIGNVLSVTMAMISPGMPERAKSKAWEAKLSGGVSALTIRGMHSIDPLCMCVGEFTEVSGRVSTQIKQWKLTDTGEMIDVEVPDNVMVHGVVASGAVVSAHIATVPTATPGFRMEIYGTDGALVVSTPGAPQRDANKLMGAKGQGPARADGCAGELRRSPGRYASGPAAQRRGAVSAVGQGDPRRRQRRARLSSTRSKRHRLMDAIAQNR